MSEQRFNIVFAGELHAGQDEKLARGKLAAMFKSDAARIAQLFDGRRHVVKKNVDQSTAKKYVAALAKAGAVAYAELIGDAPGSATAPAPAKRAAAPAVETVSSRSAPPAAAPAPITATAITTDEDGEFDLAPAGSDLLKESERYRPEPVKVSTDHIAIASPFITGNIEREPPPPAPDTSHIGLAEPGSDLNPNADTTPVPEAPDTSSISLAEPGGLLVEPSQEIPVSVPDIDGISLAPPGAPLDQLRDKREPLNPDTSALSLSSNGAPESARS